MSEKIEVQITADDKQKMGIIRAGLQCEISDADILRCAVDTLANLYKMAVDRESSLEDRCAVQTTMTRLGLPPYNADTGVNHD